VAPRRPTPRSPHQTTAKGQTINTHLYYYTQLLLAPLLIIGVTGFARASQKRAIVALAVAAIAVLILGVVFYDVVSGLRSLTGYIATHRPFALADIQTVEFSYVVMAAGNALASAAAVIALSQTARLGRWRWFAGLALMTLFAQAIALVFSQGFPLADLWPGLYALYQRGDPSFGAAFFTTVSILIVLTPLVSLLYGLRGPSEPKEASDSPAP
jgi:hypothetical protein